MQVNSFLYRLMIISHRLKEKFWALKWFDFKMPAEKGTPALISCIDGRCFHGGLCDRFKGIVSTYLFCKKNNIPFRIHYIYPFNLEDYLEPNRYDWRLKSGEYKDNIWTSAILYLVADGSPKRLYRPKSKQVHVYANRDTTCLQDSTAQWGILFKELFKPSKLLSDAIEKLNFGQYVALVFRFQNLLGDFKEYHFQPLDTSEQSRLLTICQNAVIQMSEKYPDKNLLVSSDSFRFLNAVQSIPRVHIVPGKLAHIDTPIKENSTKDVFLKSFVDFFMISKAEKIFCIGTKQMYSSEFPLYAAKLNDIPFERICLD